MGALKILLPLIAAVVTVSPRLVAGEFATIEQRLQAAATDEAALVAVAGLYLEAERLAEAKKLYRKVLRLHPSSRPAALGEARVAIVEETLARAKKACRSLRNRYRKEPIADLCFGWLWLSHGRVSRADEFFVAAAALGSTWEAALGRAEAERLAGRYRQAVAAYGAASEQGADHRALIGRGLALEALGKTKESRAAFELAVTEQNGSCLAQLYFARALGDNLRAKSHIERALVLRPDWIEAYVLFGERQLSDNDFAAAESSFGRAISLGSESGVAIVGLGVALSGLGKHDAAVGTFNKAIARAPHLAIAYLELADVQIALGDEYDALDNLESAMQRAPSNPEVLFRAGRTFYQLKRYTRARAYLLKSLSMESGRSTALEMLGDIACFRKLYEQGRGRYGAALKGDRRGIDVAAIKKKQAACQPE